MSQASFDFTSGLTVQFKTLRDVLSTVVHSARGGLDLSAAACDLAPSLLSRMLNRGQADERNLDVNHIEAIISATGDLRPVYWMVEKFLQDPERMRAQAAQQLAQLLPAVLELAHQAGVTASAAKKASRR
jgi:hypothetical protein